MAASGAAAGDAEPIDFGSGQRQLFLAVGKRQRHAFEHGLGDGTSRAAGAETEHHAARLWIVEGGAFAGEIGKEQ